jgi:hypothetical protein
MLDKKLITAGRCGRVLLHYFVLVASTTKKRKIVMDRLYPHGALSLSPTGLKPVQDYFSFLQTVIDQRRDILSDPRKISTVPFIAEPCNIILKFYPTLFMNINSTLFKH